MPKTLTLPLFLVNHFRLLFNLQVIVSKRPVSPYRYRYKKGYRGNTLRNSILTMSGKIQARLWSTLYIPPPLILPHSRPGVRGQVQEIKRFLQFSCSVGVRLGFRVGFGRRATRGRGAARLGLRGRGGWLGKLGAVRRGNLLRIRGGDEAVRPAKMLFLLLQSEPITHEGREDRRCD